MTWTEWLLIALAVYALCDIIASIVTAICAEKVLKDEIEKD